MMSHRPLAGQGLPPGPNLSATQQTLRWLTRPFEFLRACARQFGDAFTLDFGSHGRYVLFAHPDAIRAIFLGDPTQLHAGKGNAVLRPFLGHHSLLLLEEQRHLAERRLLLRAFHRNPVGTYGSLIREVTLEAVRDWRPGQPVVIQDVMQGIALEVIVRLVFGLGEGERFAELKRRLQAFLNDPRLNLVVLGQLGDDLGSTATGAAFRQGFERLDQLLFAEVARRRGEGDPTRGDMLGMLLAARDEDGGALDDVALRDELVTLLVTGYETTATALAWAFSWLHREPGLRRRLGQELAAVTGDDPAALAGLKYLDAVCKETLRIHPVIPLVARQVQRPVPIQGYVIPAGVTVAPCIYLTHHREELYPQPDAFRPERFLAREYSPYEFLPFGGGVRRCLGMPLALQEMKIVLGTILQRYELEAAWEEPVRPVRRAVTIAPSGGTRLTVARVR